MRKFIRTEWTFLLFATMMCFWSSVGQTFFIALFSDELRGMFALSHGEFSTIYMVATLCSALCLIKIGALIDRFSLLYYSLFVIGGIICAALFITHVQALWMLYVGIFLLRFFGQGLMSLTSSTAVARRYNDMRGRALAITALGYPISEALLPPIVITLLSYMAWPLVWYSIIGAVIITIAIPLPYLLRRTARQDGVRMDVKPIKKTSTITIKHVMSQRVFYYMLPLIFINSAFITAILLHQLYIVDIKNWSINLWATSFMLYAVASVSCSMLAGIIIDKFGAKNIAFINVIPLFIALLGLAVSSSPLIIFVIMLCMGAAGGTASIIVSALWAEIFGIENLGTLKAFSMFIMVTGSAVGPVLLGYGIDYGINFTLIMYIGMIVTVLSAVNAWFLRYHQQ